MAVNLLAYIDPGSGLLVWQFVVAAFVGFIFYLKKTRKIILACVRKPFRKNPPPPVAEWKDSQVGDVNGKS